MRPYTHTSIAATVLCFFFHLQITIARAYISKSIHVAFRNESSLNIYVHICFLNENCYGKSRAECEKSRSSQPYFSTIQKYLVSSVRQWERIETNRYKKMFVLVCTFQNSIVFVLWLSGGYCCFAAVWRLFFLLFISPVVTFSACKTIIKLFGFFSLFNVFQSHTIHGKKNNYDLIWRMAHSDN